MGGGEQKKKDSGKKERKRDVGNKSAAAAVAVCRWWFSDATRRFRSLLCFKATRNWHETDSKAQMSFLYSFSTLLLPEHSTNDYSVMQFRHRFVSVEFCGPVAYTR